MIVRWIGVDCHVATTTVAILNEDEAKARHRRFNNTEEAWAAFCRDEVDATTHLVLEASAGIWPVYDRLVSAGAAEVLVAHPLRVKAIAAARVKTDRVDARTLALLGRGGLIPTVWVPSPQERLLRSLVRRRVSLARAATAQKNQTHAVLRRQGLLAGTWCLDAREGLSPGQSDEIDRVCRIYPHLTDDEFVQAHRDEWLR
jgi:transposase